MPTNTISVPVDVETAKAYAAVSPQEQKKIQLLLGLRLRDLARKQAKPLAELMDEISEKARQRGLTAEILESLLGES
jgi:hypothetical protein